MIHAFSEAPDALTAALRAARHAVEALDADVTVQVVVQGGAVRGLTTGTGFVQDVTTALAGAGVEVVACANSMQRARVERGDLLRGVGTVPSAVGHIAEQQWGGAAYVRI